MLECPDTVWQNRDIIASKTSKAESARPNVSDYNINMNCVHTTKCMDIMDKKVVNRLALLD